MIKIGGRGAKSSAGSSNGGMKWSRNKKIPVNTPEGKVKMSGITSGDYTIIQDDEAFRIFKQLAGANRPIEVGSAKSLAEAKAFSNAWENPTRKWKELKEPRDKKGIQPVAQSGKYTINDEKTTYGIYENGKRIGSSTSSLNEIKGLVEVYDKFGTSLLNKPREKM